MFELLNLAGCSFIPGKCQCSHLIIILLEERIVSCSFREASITCLPRLTKSSGILHYLVDVAREVGIHDPCV